MAASRQVAAVAVETAVETAVEAAAEVAVDLGRKRLVPGDQASLLRVPVMKPL